MGFCSCTSKYILFFFNLAIALLGLGVLGVGVWGSVSTHAYAGGVSASSIAVIVFGGSVFLLAFFGCWGAIQESRCLLNLYGGILSCLLIGLIAIGIVIMTNKDTGVQESIKYIDQIFEKALHDDSAAMKEADLIQSSGECCGLDGPLYWSLHGRPVPVSCCPSNNNGQFCDLSQAFRDGCETKVEDSLKYLLKFMGIFAIVIGSVEFLGVFMAFFLAHSIRRTELRSYT